MWDEKTGAPWEADTMVTVFSATKGLAAAAIPSSRVATVKAFSMWQLFLNDPRERALREACCRCIQRTP